MRSTNYPGIANKNLQAGRPIAFVSLTDYNLAPDFPSPDRPFYGLRRTIFLFFEPPGIFFCVSIEQKLASQTAAESLA